MRQTSCSAEQMAITTVPHTRGQEAMAGPPEAAAQLHAVYTAADVQGADVLVVIPAYNEEKHIEACIRSLTQGPDSRIADADIVVMDGMSEDGTRQAVERLMKVYPRLVLMDNPDRLQSAAINRAARMMGAGKKILVRCDAHASYPPDYVMQVADSLARRGYSSIATPMDADGTNCFQRANAFIVDTPFGSGGSAHRGGRVSKEVDHGHHAGFDMATFLKLGGYDPTFSHNEDGEYDHRLRAAGGKIFLDAAIRVRYTPRASVQALARQYYRYGRGRARNLMKHREWPRVRQMIPQIVLTLCVLGFVLAPVEPWALLLPAGYLAALSLVSLWAMTAMRSACGLMAGVASAVMHMSWAAGFIRQWLAGSGPDKGRNLPPLEPIQPTHAE